MTDMKLTRKQYLQSGFAIAAATFFSSPLLEACRRKAPLISGKSLPASSNTEVKTGGVKMVEIDGGYKVWTKKIGNGKIKMLTLHGGPGCTHEYFECFEDFLPQEGIEFY
jgi:proline iminopeptidase